MTLLWWHKDRGDCVMCGRPMGKRKISHFIEPPPFCLGTQRQSCNRIFKQRLMAGLS